MITARTMWRMLPSGNAVHRNPSSAPPAASSAYSNARQLVCPTQGASPDGIPSHPAYLAPWEQHSTAFSELSQIAPRRAPSHSVNNESTRSERLVGEVRGTETTRRTGWVWYIALPLLTTNFLTPFTKERKARATDMSIPFTPPAFCCGRFSKVSFIPRRSSVCLASQETTASPAASSSSSRMSPISGCSDITSYRYLSARVTIDSSTTSTRDPLMTTDVASMVVKSTCIKSVAAIPRSVLHVLSWIITASPVSRSTSGSDRAMAALSNSLALFALGDFSSRANSARAKSSERRQLPSMSCSRARFHTRVLWYHPFLSMFMDIITLNTTTRSSKSTGTRGRASGVKTRAARLSSSMTAMGERQLRRLIVARTSAVPTM
mmetsp:Transcript_17728/g.57331  ORF Transcript_17728/g.57331 Transcript_17728/m.57331 type:complete len:378 (-) Transcript_17728:2461-3594(-)